MKYTLLRLLYKIYTLQFFFTRPIVIGVRVILIREGQVLLVKHTYQDGWLLPGGGIKRKETPEQAARRECLEEVGADIGKLELVGIYSQFLNYKNDHIILFISKDFSIVPKSDFEIERVEFFDVGCLPDDMMPGNRQRIEEYVHDKSRALSEYW